MGNYKSFVIAGLAALGIGLLVGFVIVHRQSSSIGEESPNKVAYLVRGPVVEIAGPQVKIRIQRTIKLSGGQTSSVTDLLPVVITAQTRISRANQPDGSGIDVLAKQSDIKVGSSIQITLDKPVPDSGLVYPTAILIL